MGTFTHFPMYCDSVKISWKVFQVHSCYKFSALSKTKYVWISCCFHYITADFRRSVTVPIIGQLWPNYWLGNWRGGLSEGCAYSPRIIDARSQLYWKWRGNRNGPLIGGLPSHCTRFKQNHRKLLKFDLLTQNFDHFILSMCSLKIQIHFVQIVFIWCHKRRVKISLWKLPPWIAVCRCKMSLHLLWFLGDFHNVRIRAVGWNFIHCRPITYLIEYRWNFYF